MNATNETAATIVARYDFAEAAEKSARSRNLAENTTAYRVERDLDLGNFVVIREA
jgi:hypothetical protein